MPGSTKLTTKAKYAKVQPMRYYLMGCFVMVLFLNSCIMTTNLGGFTDDLAVDKAYRISTKADKPDQDHNWETASPHDFSIYELDGKYYMELYYAMAQKETALLRAKDVWGNEGTYIRMWKADEERIKNLTPSPYMVQLNKKLVYECLQIEINEADDAETVIIPKDEFDFSRATRCTPKLTRDSYHKNYHELAQYLPVIPEQKGTVHYLLQPISWPLKVVDAIPICLYKLSFWLVTRPYAIKEQLQSDRPIYHPKLGTDSERIP